MLNENAFSRLVAEDVKNRATEEQQQLLRSPENWERWRRSLIDLIGNLSQQVAQLESALNADIKRYKRLGKSANDMIVSAQIAYEDRTNKIKRFQFYVEQRLVEVERLIALGDGEVAAQDTMLTMLRKAIEEHKALSTALDFEPHEIDLALWATLEGRWLFDDIDDAL